MARPLRALDYPKRLGYPLTMKAKHTDQTYTLNTIPSDETEARTLMSLSLGRIFRLLSRPFQEGDIEQYEMARAAFYRGLDMLKSLGLSTVKDNYQPNFARDYRKGDVTAWD